MFATGLQPFQTLRTTRAREGDTMTRPLLRESDLRTRVDVYFNATDGTEIRLLALPGDLFRVTSSGKGYRNTFESEDQARQYFQLQCERLAS